MDNFRSWLAFVQEHRVDAPPAAEEVQHVTFYCVDQGSVDEALAAYYVSVTS